jgi:hypothetical protein
VEMPRGVRVTQVAAGDGFSLALADTGAIYAWGSYKDETASLRTFSPATRFQKHPGLIYEPETVRDRARKVSAGVAHCAALTQRGEVLTWGFGPAGQLGRVDPYDATGLTLESSAPMLQPAPVEGIAEACGYDEVGGGGGLGGLPRTAWPDAPARPRQAPGAAQKVGPPRAGRAGCMSPRHPGSAQRARPDPLRCCRRTQVKDVSCGVYCTFVITKSGKVVAWGLNNLCQLGLDNGKSERAGRCWALRAADCPPARQPSTHPCSCARNHGCQVAPWALLGLAGRASAPPPSASPLGHWACAGARSTPTPRACCRRRGRRAGRHRRHRRRWRCRPRRPRRLCGGGAGGAGGQRGHRRVAAGAVRGAGEPQGARLAACQGPACLPAALPGRLGACLGPGRLLRGAAAAAVRWRCCSLVAGWDRPCGPGRRLCAGRHRCTPAAAARRRASTAGAQNSLHATSNQIIRLQLAMLGP